jgi:hypothetical protein
MRPRGRRRWFRRRPRRVTDPVAVAAGERGHLNPVVGTGGGGPRAGFDPITRPRGGATHGPGGVQHVRGTGGATSGAVLDRVVANTGGAAAYVTGCQESVRGTFRAIPGAALGRVAITCARAAFGPGGVQYVLGTGSATSRAVLDVSSQAPAEPRQTVVEGLNTSVGHAALLPVQASAMSQPPGSAG